MDYEDERKRLVELLQVPITRVEVEGFRCDLYFRRELVGTLPVTRSASGIRYEVTAHTTCVDWPKLFEMNYFALKSAVADKLAVSNFRIVPMSCRRLFIEDAEGNLFASFQCSFLRGKWSVVDEKILI